VRAISSLPYPLLDRRPSLPRPRPGNGATSPPTPLRAGAGRASLAGQEGCSPARPALPLPVEGRGPGGEVAAPLPRPRSDAERGARRHTGAPPSRGGKGAGG
jgi:hypothetical protein